MIAIRKNLFYVSLLMTLGVVSCAVEEIIQPISFSSLTLDAGWIFEGEYEAHVSPASPVNPVPLSSFGLEIRIDDWEDVGVDVEGANTYVSENAIVEFSITSDSVIMVTADSIYVPGEDLSALFKTDRAGRSRFDPRFSLDRLIGRNLSFDPFILQLVCTLERDLHQTFVIDLTMDDGQGYSIQSNMVRVSKDE